MPTPLRSNKSFPGEDMLAHLGAQWVESAETVFSSKKLLAVLRGEDPMAAKAIKDVDLDDIPELPTDHRLAGQTSRSLSG